VVDLVGHNEVVAATEPERALTETVTMSHRLAEAMHRNGTPRVSTSPACTSTEPLSSPPQ
jgi:hypothetical protein